MATDPSAPISPLRQRMRHDLRNIQIHQHENGVNAGTINSTVFALRFFYTVTLHRRELFDAVQAKLAERTNPRSPNASRKVVSLLAGMIHDHHGRPMSPTHTQNHGRRYRYYVSNIADDATVPALRLPAGELDAIVRKQLAALLTDSDRTRELIPDDAASQLAAFAARCASLGQDIASASITELRGILQSIDLALRVGPNGIEASFSKASLLREAGIEWREETRIEFAIPTHRASFGHEPRLRLDPRPGVPRKVDQRLIDAVGRGFAARERLLAMREHDVAAMPRTELRHLERVARLSYLDPTIVRSILDGDQPSNLSARDLWRWNSLPLVWTDQRDVLWSKPS